MSVFWETDHFGYDGDFIHGHVKVNYWEAGSEAEFAAELDRQYAALREAALAERPRLVGDGDRG